MQKIVEKFEEKFVQKILQKIVQKIMQKNCGKNTTEKIGGRRMEKFVEKLYIQNIVQKNLCALQ